MPTLDRVANCRPALLAIILGLGPCSQASAQEGAVAPGERVRVTVPCDTTDEARPLDLDRCAVEGTVVRFTPDTLVLADVGSRGTPPPGAIDGLEVRRIVGPSWQIPTGVGFLLGGGGTYAWLHSGGSTSLCDRSRNQDAMNRGECIGLTVLGGAVGAGLGALTAALLRTERWIDLPLGRVHLTIVR